MLTALHGFTEDDLVWPELLAPLGVALCCPLLPGHGAKPCPEGTTVVGVARDLAACCFADGPGDLLGYSMGGRIALHLALDRPQSVRRLVLISSGPGFQDGALQGSRRTTEMALAETLEDNGIGPFVAMWEANPILRPAKPLPLAVEAALRCRRLSHEPLGLAGALRRLGAGAMPNLWGRLGELRVPVLLIAGAADARYCKVMQEMAALMTDARFTAIPDAGHAVHREQPAALLRVIAGFLGDGHRSG